MVEAGLPQKTLMKAYWKLLLSVRVERFSGKTVKYYLGKKPKYFVSLGSHPTMWICPNVGKWPGSCLSEPLSVRQCGMQSLLQNKSP